MKIALLGYGEEGKSAYRYYSGKFPDASFTVYDNAAQPKFELPRSVKFVGGVRDFHAVKADLLVRTPAIAPSKVSSIGQVTSVTKEFFEVCPAPIIGVTGTKGKGTTCSLIAEILKAADKTIWLVGNIGTPALDVLGKIKPSDIVVYELSSFQLWDLKKSPHIAVVLMIEPDHMDVHTSLVEYVVAKTKIALFQTKKDVMIYHPTNQLSVQVAKASPAQDKKRFCTVEATYLENHKIIIDSKIICKKDEVGLLGEHNIENICAAVSAAWHFTQDITSIKTAIKNFHGLPHRLEFVREVKAIKFYNDSFSSAPGATLAAIKSFESPEIVIMGGKDKRVNWDDFAKSVSKIQNIKKIILIGQTKQTIATSLKKAQFDRFDMVETTNFSEIINHAFKQADNGDVVLLSPGCSSFDMFKDFYERGEQFKQIVSKLHE